MVRQPIKGPWSVCGRQAPYVVELLQKVMKSDIAK